MQKVLLVVLLLLLVGLQYKLWVGPGSLPDSWNLQDELAEQRREIDELRERNARLEAEVADLKAGLDAIEERARSELGMVGKDEKFYRVVTPDKKEQDDDKAAQVEEPQAGDEER